MPIEIREHTPGKDVRDFIDAGFVVFRSDPMWVPPLDFEFKERLSPKHNPFFNRADVTLFTAWKDGKLAGRCSATIDREHLKLWKDDTGFFGFFDTLDDQDVAKALMSAAERWLKGRGMKRMIGPLSLYANDEIGCLIEGFDYPPNLMMAHSRKYQAKLIEGCGCEKEKDLFCWKYEATQPFPDRVTKAWEHIKSLPEVTLRSVDPSKMERELEDIMDIYNTAWAGKWGMVPALPDEVKKIAKDMKLIIDPDIAFMAEIRGKSVGMCIMLPNLNEAIADLGGKLFPFGFAKLLWRVKVKHPESARLMMLGIKGEARSNVKRYGGLSAAMYVEVAKRGYAKGYRWGELSWTREDDAPINLGIRSMGAKIYKKYRVFKKDLTQTH
jgi:GNAT superfamily N-acetyltransferase